MDGYLVGVRSVLLRRWHCTGSVVLCEGRWHCERMAMSRVELRTCRDCGHMDFAHLLTKYGVRAYRHSVAWRTRCDWMKDHPQASLSDAKASGLPGVAFAK